MSTQVFSVDGLHCRGCAQTIKDVVIQLPGVESVTVDLDTKGTSRVTVSADHELAAAELQRALDRDGDNFAVV
ncbi:heavy-metal-associated domain-containing protein [Nocardia sp. CA-129566]|uniref:heavy-metal-associated domain-containing protein n=1 Tax=Nocardia sp. CA-129566 TaxID=3239976 RepID=UPI003D974A41